MLPKGKINLEIQKKLLTFNSFYILFYRVTFSIHDIFKSALLVLIIVAV